jgi:hypothetical protein
MAEAKNQDAIALLKQDHRDVEELFEKFEKASGSDRKRKLAEQICLALSVHTELEEKIFYPACEGEVEEDLLQEAYVEHDGAKVLIAQILKGSPSDDFYDAKVKVLQEEIEHHVKEEEESGGVFSQAKKAKLDLDSLGAKMAALKSDLTQRFEADGIPEPQFTTMDEVSV